MTNPVSRSPLLLGCLLALSACTFDPQIPSARVICAKTGDCPSGFTCESLSAAGADVSICCKQKGCASSLSQDSVRQLVSALKDAAVEQPREAGVSSEAGPTTEAGDAREAGPTEAGPTEAGPAAEAGGPTCGNGRLDPGETCDGDCPTACPRVGCQFRKLVGSAADCSAACVDDTGNVIDVCMSGDNCCASGCTKATDDDCNCKCGNGVTEVACNETCDGTNCPSTCPPVGCQLRMLQGTAPACTAKCVDAADTIKDCVGGDGCCPTTCNANTDSDCKPTCGNSVVEAGESCDPPSACQAQSDACVNDKDHVRVKAGAVASCTFTCTTTARTCGGAQADTFCPTACMPCGDTCAAGQDIDCKNDNGTPCTSTNQCKSGNCAHGFCCSSPCAGACQTCSTGTCATSSAGAAGSPSCGTYLCDGISAGCPTSCGGSSICSAGNFCSGGHCVCQPSCPTTCTQSSSPDGCGGTCFRNCNGCCMSDTECVLPPLSCN